MEQLDENTPLFVISVAAELAAMHPQTLRQYDRMGLVVPVRTLGGGRRYTMRNVAQLRERVLELENQNAELKARIRDLEAALANELMQRPGGRVFAAGDSGVESIAPGQRPTKRTSLVLWRAR
jgi:MerR family transcriptional regulator/heat shock protein HspR